MRDVSLILSALLLSLFFASASQAQTATACVRYQVSDNTFDRQKNCLLENNDLNPLIPCERRLQFALPPILGAAAQLEADTPAVSEENLPNCQDVGASFDGECCLNVPYNAPPAELQAPNTYAGEVKDRTTPKPTPPQPMSRHPVCSKTGF